MQMSGKPRHAEQESTWRLRDGHEPTLVFRQILRSYSQNTQEHSKTSSLGSLRAKVCATRGSSPPELDPGPVTCLPPPAQGGCCCRQESIL